MEANMEVMTFNLKVRSMLAFRHCWKRRLPRAIAIIRRYMPDILCTQEGLSSMLDGLQEQLPEYGRVGSGRQEDGSGEHTAIFYRQDRWKLIRWGQFWLSETPELAGSRGWDGRFPRICTWVEVEEIKQIAEESGQAIRIYNTHLDSGGATARLQGAVLMRDMMRRHAEEFPLPAIVAGDFNAKPDSEVIRFMEQDLTLEFAPDRDWVGRLENAYRLIPSPGPGRTFHDFLGEDGHGDEPGQPIDYLFSSGGLIPASVHVERCQVLGGYPSDHYPVVAAFRLER